VSSAPVHGVHSPEEKPYCSCHSSRSGGQVCSVQGAAGAGVPKQHCFVVMALALLDAVKHLNVFAYCRFLRLLGNVMVLLVLAIIAGARVCWWCRMCCRSARGAAVLRGSTRTHMPAPSPPGTWYAVVPANYGPMLLWGRPGAAAGAALAILLFTALVRAWRCCCCWQASAMPPLLQRCTYPALHIPPLPPIYVHTATNHHHQHSCSTSPLSCTLPLPAYPVLGGCFACSWLCRP
jgi:hypothetical protein